MNFVDVYFGALDGKAVKAFLWEGGILCYGAQGREAVVVADLRGTPTLALDVQPRRSYRVDDTLVLYAGGCGCGNPIKTVSPQEAENHLLSTGVPV